MIPILRFEIQFLVVLLVVLVMLIAVTIGTMVMVTIGIAASLVLKSGEIIAAGADVSSPAGGGHAEFVVVVVVQLRTTELKAEAEFFPRCANACLVIQIVTSGQA